MYTAKGIHVERIYADEEWQSTSVPKILAFYADRVYKSLPFVLNKDDM